MPIKPLIFKPKQPPKLPEIHYSERLRRMQRAYRDVDFEYQLSSADIRNEELFNVYAHKYPDQVKSKLMTFCRVLLPEPNMFELDESGKLDETHEIREALVRSESKKVMDPKNPITNTFCQANILHGVYRRPYVSKVFDDYGNPTYKSRITDHRNVFYIEFNKANVNAVLEKFGEKYRIRICKSRFRFMVSDTYLCRSKPTRLHT